MDKITKPIWANSILHFVCLLNLLIGNSAVSGQSENSYKAEIVRDEFGVPYIIAETLPDAAFGDGYAQAEDRLNLLMENILTATGTRAAQLGASQIDRDYKARLSGARRTAYEKWGEIPLEVREIFQAYAAGVNHYIESTKKPLPSIARPIEAQEPLAMLLFSGLYRQMSQAQKDLLGQGGDPIAGEGSNGAVLGPSRSASGNSLMLSDMHTPWSGFNRWYEKHYLTPDLEAHGFMSVGCPLFLVCVTDRIGWTLTRNPGDRGDCFVLKTNPDNPNQYWFDGKYRNLLFSSEIIEVKGDETVVRRVAHTVHGPVIKQGKGKLFAAGMSVMGEVGIPGQLYAALTSRNLDDFKAACAINQMDGGNVFYTDVEGNIFFTWWNRLAVRNEKYNWLEAVDGSHKDTLYQGTLSPDQLPLSENDPGGYYQASNAADWTIGDGAWGMSPKDFPNWLLTSPERSYLPSRSQRTVDMINSIPKHKLEDVLEWSLDTRILGAEWVWPLIERAYQELGNGGNSQVDIAMKTLAEWMKNPVANKESRGYSIYREWLAVIAANEKDDPDWAVLGQVADMLNVLPALPNHPEAVPVEEVKRAHEALVKAVASLVKLHGTPTPKWGNINVIQLADGTRFPSGAADSVSQGMWQTSQNTKRSKDGMWLDASGSDGMMMAEMSSPPRVFTMVPYGQSDDPKSLHFADQTKRYTNGQYKRAWFARGKILAHAESQLSISTKGTQ
ncbi:MAG: penicillin acylase family protein [Verrucomicrobia bacterium]|nr:penicillin acylase family protein [Verrucomicrobiota bacterium]